MDFLRIIDREYFFLSQSSSSMMFFYYLFVRKIQLLKKEMLEMSRLLPHLSCCVKRM